MQCFFYTLFWWKNANSPRSGENFLHSFLHYSLKSGKTVFYTFFYTYFAAKRRNFLCFTLFLHCFYRKISKNHGLHSFFYTFSPRSGEKFYTTFFTLYLLEKRNSPIFFHSFFVEKYFFTLRKKSLKKTLSHGGTHGSLSHHVRVHTPMEIKRYPVKLQLAIHSR